MLKRIITITVTIILFLAYMSTTVSAIPSGAERNGAGGNGAAANAPVPEISAPSAILVEAESGQTLYGKNTDQRLHISVACKLMTILIAVENAGFNSPVTVSSDSVDAEGSALNLKAGDKYELGDLLYGIMLTSANDAAKAVAEHIDGSADKFVERMNAMASKLNMKNTHFTNPTGLLDDNQYTTAGDISLLLRYALANPDFSRVFNVRARPWYNSDNTSAILTSPNRLFWSYDGIEGGKIGYNKKDQQSIAATAYRNNMRLISIVLNSPEKDLFSSAAAMFDYGFLNFRKDALVKKGDVLKTAEFNGKEINLISQSDVYYVHPIGESYIKEFTATANLKPPVRKTIAVGSASYVLQDGSTVSVSLFPETEIIPPDDFWTSASKKLQENKDILFLVLFLVLLEAMFIIANLLKLIKKLFRRAAGSGKRAGS